MSFRVSLLVTAGPGTVILGAVMGDSRKALTAPGTVYGGDANLARLLVRAGSPMGAVAARRLAEGVAAAPQPFDAEAWMTLVVPRLTGRGRLGRELKGQLAALLARVGEAREGGLEGGVLGDRRLGLLRAELHRRRLSGFIVPHGDQYQSEYLAGSAERLAWLTGFKGSAGLAVVLMEEASIFVDGRYTLQARDEVDGSRFSIHHLVDQPAPDWVARHVPSKSRLGYDPWLHTANGAARFAAACGRAGARLVALDDNPVDAVWVDRPPPPLSPVTVHEAAFAGLGSAAKRRRVGRALAAEGQDAALLTAPDSVAWLLNLRGGDVPFAPLPHAFAMVHADARVELFIDRRKLTPRVLRHLGRGVRVAGTGALGAAIDRLGIHGGTLRLDPDGSPAWAFERARKSGATTAHGIDPCALFKACKNPVEMSGMRAAHRRDGAALSGFLAWLAGLGEDPGTSEMEAARRLDGMRRKRKFHRGPSFSTISAAGANGALVHYRVTGDSDRRLEPGSLYLVDSGGQYLDGTTDVTRTVAIGEPDDEMRDRFTRVLKGHIAIARARFPEGTSGSQLDVLARRALWEAGLDYDHGTGHGVGSFLCVHEGPQRISKIPNRVALEPGMILSNEPGYYKPGAYGIRIENLVAVIPAPAPRGAEKEMLGFETLTLAPIDLNLVDHVLLTVDERAWLDAYHARVREVLTPMVSPSVAAWLRKATRRVGRGMSPASR